jgi:hypothetical protein
MIALLGSVLAASVLGSPHCAGMCGGFVCFYSGDDARVRPLAHLAYHGSRLAAYALLGALAGSLGAGVDRFGAWAGVNRAAAVVAGVVMIVWGGAALGRALGLRLPEWGTPAFTHGALGRALRALRDQPPAVRAAVIGGLSGVLPCGWLYAYVAFAAGTGSPARGALLMTAFWLGTVPILAGIGLAAQRGFEPLRRQLPLVTAALMVALGGLSLAGKLMPITARPVVTGPAPITGARAAAVPGASPSAAISADSMSVACPIHGVMRVAAPGVKHDGH